MKEIEFWVWWWGIDDVVSEEPKIFYNFNEMKNYSANHSKIHKTNGYFSDYEKIVRSGSIQVVKGV